MRAALACTQPERSIASTRRARSEADAPDAGAKPSIGRSDTPARPPTAQAGAALALAGCDAVGSGTAGRGLAPAGAGMDCASLLPFHSTDDRHWSFMQAKLSPVIE